MKITITKKFDDRLLFDHREFTFAEGKITCLLGESGVGKTTLLRALAGLDDFEGEKETHGNLSIAFQEPRLLPHASAKGNLTFVGVEDEAAKKWLEWVEIADESQSASTLSGGEKQRVALARALAKESELLLLDEPFSSVDTARKVRLLKKLRPLLVDQKRTTIFVTHDIDEAVFVADEIILISNGGKTATFSVSDEDRKTFGTSSLRAKIYEEILG
ncbi:MAG: ABC transporter ATP-binding protein [Clostridia bacterium]|nr:ABC transporter ATP-binding protein [Clostridia bacterium]